MARLRKRKAADADKGTAPDGQEKPAAYGAQAKTDDVMAVVFAAAIAAYEDDEYGAEDAVTDLKIKNIDRSAGVLPAWGVAGNRESIDARRFRR